jgi:hypothetical protein
MILDRDRCCEGEVVQDYDLGRNAQLLFLAEFDREF